MDVSYRSTTHKLRKQVMDNTMKKLLLIAAATMTVASGALAHNYNGVRLYANNYHNDHNKPQFDYRYRTCVYSKSILAGNHGNIAITVKGFCPLSIMYHPESRTWHR